MIIQRNDRFFQTAEADLLFILLQREQSRLAGTKTSTMADMERLTQKILYDAAQNKRSCISGGNAPDHDSFDADEYADCDEGCMTCIHEDECAEIGGRQEGRGFGSACRPPLDKPHYQRRKQ